MATSLLTITSDSQSKPFSRDELLLHIYDSLKHRKTAMNDATALTDTIIGRIVSKNSEAIITNAYLSDIVDDVLQNFDKVSSIHYQAYYGPN